MLHHIVHYPVVPRHGLLDACYPADDVIVLALQAADMRRLVAMLLRQLRDLLPHDLQLRGLHKRVPRRGTGTAARQLALDTVQVTYAARVEAGVAEHPGLRAREADASVSKCTSFARDNEQNVRVRQPVVSRPLRP